MRINACFIVKDNSELNDLRIATASVFPFVDGVYVTATGENVDKIEEFVTKNFMHYSYFKWENDFAKARNFNFSQVPKDTDYIFWMDSDDYLVGGKYLREVAKKGYESGKDIIFFTYWYGCSFKGENLPKNMVGVDMEHMRERLLRPGVTKWVGRLHETPVPTNGVKENYTAYKYDPETQPIAIMHRATEELLPQKMMRNKELLELQLKEEREKGEADPRTLLYLMKIYTEMNDKELWKKTIEYGEEYLKKSGWDEERGVCAEHMAIATGKLGDDRQTIKYLHKAIEEWPNQPLFYIRLAKAYYNVKNYRSCKHWMTVASSMDLDNKGTNITNFKGMKVEFAQLLLNYTYNVEKNTKKALEAANLLMTEMPTKENNERLLFLQDLNDLNEACRNTDLLMRYLHEIEEDKSIIPILNALPDAIQTQPFAQNLRKSVTQPRRWKENEICYFANFGTKFFEKWDDSSLESGIGGSETAIISLSKRWAKMGYKVTIYGDPLNKGTRDGVTWLPWYYFNIKDSFNIFIQWRGWQLSGKVKSKRFYVDLHDIYSTIDIKNEQVQAVDKFMVKSDYHRKLGLSLPEDKVLVISNGIEV